MIRTRPTPPTRSRAAALSIASNTALILLKLVAGAVTGSVAILTEAMHSSIDLLASIVAFFSVRKADEPADESHRYGHEKIENLAAAIEGMLILVGSGVIVFESVRRLAEGGAVDQLGLGIAVIAFSMVANLGGQHVHLPPGARDRLGGARGRRRAPAHRRADLGRRAGRPDPGAGHRTRPGSTRWSRSWSRRRSSFPECGSCCAPRACSSTRRCPRPSSTPSARRSSPFGPRGVAGFHKLRTRRAGARRYVDLHVQFRAGTTLEDAHATAHALQDAIRGRLRGADVLIHLEPEDRVQPGTEI